MAIIKCPECGHEVSDAAERCPSCGVAIAGNVKKCGDCGKIMLRSATECPSCGAVMPSLRPLEQKHSPVSGDAANYLNVDPYAPARKQKSNRQAVVIAVVAVIVVALAALAYWLVNNAKTQRAEEECYNEVIASADTTLLAHYLETYPKGAHADEVKQKLQSLVAEIADWNDACVANTKSVYVEFLKKHTGSAFEQACTDKIDSLDFSEAVAAGTPEALQIYSASHPNGKYLQQCAELEANLTALKVQPAEAEQVKTLCARFFSALAENSESTIASVTEEVMDNFLNRRGATQSDVEAYATRLASSTARPEFVINDNFSITKTISETTGEKFMNATFTVTEISTASDGTESRTAYSVNTRITPRMKITSLTMRRLAETAGEQ